MQAPTLFEVLREFGNDTSCREYLEALRWPDRVMCPRCQSEKISRVYDRNQFDCDSCRYQFSVLAGTVFQDTKLPLPTWFAVTYLMCESKKGISASQLKRMVGGSYKTSWYLCHRIRAAMKEANPLPLSGVVEMDETYVGGKRRGSGKKGRPGRGEAEVVFGIKQRGGELRFFHAEDCKSGTLAKYIKENVSGDVDVIMTDEMISYPHALDRAGHSRAKHKTIKHRDGIYVDGDITTNGIESAFSLLKRGIVGTWHKISAKHLSAYLDEMQFRFNNRQNPYLFRDTMQKLIETPVLEYKNLIAA
ncbi:IS1595 family transposase [Edaphobacter acidisoli]|uniref:IS1595 family transposase n=1 Tax=Edaphobacter acidisoli TaxID=2040573 RepID=A0A916S2N0_9BACT|nr:IS1595 family transposase [Edaphobacter acidisoli]GGA80923.1 IS1595 family transposase [Edaphobacter acidisoli]